MEPNMEPLPSSPESDYTPVEQYIIRNATIASYCGEPPATGSFTLFPRLPAEIRIRIWHHAISVPRIVEVEEMDDPRRISGTVGLSNERWKFKNTNPPPLLSTCKESRQEILKEYKNYTDVTMSIAGPEWIRFDWDILYLKNLDFAKNGYGFTLPGFERSIQRWRPADIFDAIFDTITEESDKWIGRPDLFQHVTTLAINRETFYFGTYDDCECIIRHFFPNLAVLIILIGNDINTELECRIKENDFAPYDVDWDRRFPRYDAVPPGKGPFNYLTEVNRHYGEYIMEDVETRFLREEEYAGYATPVIEVMGCDLPHWADVDEFCWPDPFGPKSEEEPLDGDGWSEDEKALGFEDITEGDEPNLESPAKESDV
jgi:hypothetical protein